MGWPDQNIIAFESAPAHLSLWLSQLLTRTSEQPFTSRPNAAIHHCHSRMCIETDALDDLILEYPGELAAVDSIFESNSLKQPTSRLAWTSLFCFNV